MPPSLASTSGMPNKDRSFHEAPEKAGGDGWLYSEQQQQLSNRWGGGQAWQRLQPLGAIARIDQNH